MDEREKSFRELYEATHERLRKVIRKGCIRYGLREDLTEDIMQETYTEMFVKQEALEKHTATDMWLYVTAVNKIRNAKNKKENYWVSLNTTTYAVHGSSIELYETLSDINGDAGYREAELTMVLQGTLKPEELLLLERIYREGYRITELADEMGISEDRMKMRVWRIREKVRKQIYEQ